MTLLCSSQREGSCMAEDDAVDIEHADSNRFEEYELIRNDCISQH